MRLKSAPVPPAIECRGVPPAPASRARGIALSLRLWLQAIRPRTLCLAASPVVLGVAITIAESGRASPWLALATLAAALLIQIGTNLANDAADGERGTDRADRIGPVRLTAAGLVPSAVMWRAAFIAFAAAAMIGAALLVSGGLPILVIGLASFLAGYAYSAGPRPIAATPFGELFVVTFFGVVAVAGTVWLLANAFSLDAVLAGAAIGMPAAAVLFVNNHRDRIGDIRAGRRTLAIRVGPSRAWFVYAALLLAPALPLGILWTRVPPEQPLWVAALYLPYAFWLVADFRRTPVGPELNGLLARTAQAQVALALLLALALLA